MAKINGSKALVSALGTLVVLGIAAILGFSINHSGGVADDLTDHIVSAADDLTDHEAVAGHPVIVDRVLRLQADVTDIRTEQKVQGGKIDAIFRTVVGEAPPP